MVEMSVRKKHVTNRAQILDHEITDARPGIDEYVIIDKQGRSPRPRADTATAT